MTAAFWTQDRIQTLRVKAREGDKPALRLALMQSLASTDIHPVGMPPSAVFMIRYLNDPLPGTLTHKKQNNSRWCTALRDSLDLLYRQASKPSQCTVSGDPPAIVFRDQAELLSCLLVDVCEQRVGQHWWWQNQHFSSMHCSQRIRDVLINEARYIPAIFSRLAGASKAIDVIKQIERQHAWDLAQVLLHEFSLESLSSLMNSFENEIVDDTASINRAPGEIKNVQRHRQRATHSHAVPPWVSLFSDEIWQVDLQPEQATLLGLACTLHQRPGLVRNRIFQRSFVHWWAAASKLMGQDDRRENNNLEIIFPSHPIDPNDVVEKRSNGSRSVLDVDSTQQDQTSSFPRRITDRKDVKDDSNFFYEGAETGKHTTKTFETDKSSTGSDEDHTKGISSRIKKSSGSDIFQPDFRNLFSKKAGGTSPDKIIEITGQEHLAGRDLDIASYGAAFTNKQSASKQHAVGEVSKNQREHKTQKNELLEEMLDGDDEVNLHFSDTFIDTRLGGLIFLINLLQQLDLPRSFSEDWKLDQQLSPWAMLDLLARALLGKQFESFYLDPVWRVLAKLDGRATKLQIAKKFSGQKNYRIPQDWYSWLDSDQVYWASFRKVLRIWTPACVLVETEFEGNPFESCLGEMHRYDASFAKTRLQQAAYRAAPLDVRSHLQEKGINAELARFLSLLTPFVREFLRRQLSMNKADKRDLVRELLQLDSRIYLSSSHIDLVTGIDNTRFTLRCAGLDQNPGWLPEYGRVVLIHFS